MIRDLRDTLGMAIIAAGSLVMTRDGLRDFLAKVTAP